ncbi:hypothetical protein [Dichotomicrobium thermohalophilum]|uniref:Uncharacterized protein n=1 Tax=Dichotomicrobium thermohalophilum TaxID=933063 RepID=A0A397PJ58_9HYPH|nr:hypothetical protein [Dichotomicrobium thermohalophilum]RIA47315.1 hypothetical protein BXY53_2389 [Dichotomicrobium thermohalophilum]
MTAKKQDHTPRPKQPSAEELSAAARVAKQGWHAVNEKMGCTSSSHDETDDPFPAPTGRDGGYVAGENSRLPGVVEWFDRQVTNGRIAPHDLAVIAEDLRVMAQVYGRTKGDERRKRRPIPLDKQSERLQANKERHKKRQAKV